MALGAAAQYAMVYSQMIKTLNIYKYLIYWKLSKKRILISTVKGLWVGRLEADQQATTRSI
ncbi:hypothetical protein C5167_021497 [Papaver somniferum]|nr:hypothetical protein C5167_021497 [Papaver somniferum]